MEIQTAILTYIDALTAIGKTYHARKTIRDQLNALAAFIGPTTDLQALTPEQLEHYRVHLSDRGIKPHTMGSILSSIRQFYQWAIRTKHVRMDPTRGLSWEPPKHPQRKPINAAPPPDLVPLVSLSYDPKTVTVEEAAHLFVQHRIIKGVSSDSIDRYEAVFLGWQRWRVLQKLDPRLTAITLQELRSYFYFLRTRERIKNGHKVTYAPSTIDNNYRMIRSLFYYLEREELIPSEKANWWKNQRIPHPQVPKDIRDIYDDDTIEALLALSEEDHTLQEESRTKAIILLFLESGIRAKELCHLDDGDINFEERRILIRVGKGGKQRWAFFGARAEDALKTYLQYRAGATGGPLFRGLGSKNMGDRLTPDALRHLFRRLAKRGSIAMPPSPLHSFRHTFAHKALAAGVDGLHLQQLLGHSDIETTQRYVREHPERLASIHRQIWK